MDWTEFFNLVNSVSVFLFMFYWVYLLMTPGGRKINCVYLPANATSFNGSHYTFLFRTTKYSLKPPPKLLFVSSISFSDILMLIRVTVFSFLPDSKNTRKYSYNAARSAFFLFKRAQEQIFLNNCYNRINDSIFYAYKILTDKPIAKAVFGFKMDNIKKSTILKCLFTYGVTKPCRSPDCITAANC